MAPLSKEVKPIVCPSLPHLGPPALAVNSLWFKLFLYEMIGCGPPSILFPRGIYFIKHYFFFLPHHCVKFYFLFISRYQSQNDSQNIPKKL